MWPCSSGISHVEDTPLLYWTSFWNHMEGLDKVAMHALTQDQAHYYVSHLLQVYYIQELLVILCK